MGLSKRERISLTELAMKRVNVIPYEENAVAFGTNIEQVDLGDSEVTVCECYINSVNEDHTCHIGFSAVLSGAVASKFAVEVDGAERMKYSFAVYKTFGFEAWDYVHPLHQIVRYTDIIDAPFGALLKRESLGGGKYTAEFTGCSTKVDVRRGTCSVIRDEPDYWFDRGIDSFGDADLVYSNPLSFTHHVFLMQEEIPDGDPIPGLSDGWYVHLHRRGGIGLRL